MPSCFFELHEIAPKPRENMEPEVLFLSSKHPAQAILETAHNLNFDTLKYQIPKSIFQLYNEEFFLLPPR